MTQLSHCKLSLLLLPQEFESQVVVPPSLFNGFYHHACSKCIISMYFFASQCQWSHASCWDAKYKIVKSIKPVKSVRSTSMRKNYKQCLEMMNLRKPWKKIGVQRTSQIHGINQVAPCPPSSSCQIKSLLSTTSSVLANIEILIQSLYPAQILKRIAKNVASMVI